MYYDLRFPFRISAGAGLGYDRETGEDAEVFMQTTLDQCKGRPITEEKYKEFHESQRVAIAKAMELKLDWITCITPEEYEANLGGEECSFDEVGGIHNGGVGHNPQGVFCGECGFTTCMGCVNEHATA